MNEHARSSGPFSRSDVAPAGSFDADCMKGRDPALIAAVLPLARLVCDRYFRLRVEGLEHLVREGPALYAGNHNNGITGPEIPCTLATLWSERGPEAPVYGLAHDFAMRQCTPLGRVLHRFGGLRASQNNGRRVLEAGGQLVVYPGGDLEAYRHFRRRNEVILGDRSGFVRLAQALDVPIVPVVAYGAHRSAVILSEGESFARRTRMPEWARLRRFPVALALPWGVAVGPWVPYLPLPFPVRLRFLPAERPGPKDDPAQVRERLRASMQSALDEMAADTNEGRAS